MANHAHAVEAVFSSTYATLFNPWHCNLVQQPSTNYTCERDGHFQLKLDASTQSKITSTSPNAGSAVSNTTSTSNSNTDSVLSSTSSENSSQQLLDATNQMQELNQQFNLQYLQLQESEQAQNRQFTSLSNVSKLRSDTAKNSITNIKS